MGSQLKGKVKKIFFLFKNLVRFGQGVLLFGIKFFELLLLMLHHKLMGENAVIKLLIYFWQYNVTRR